MLNRERLLSHVHNPEDRVTMVRILDKADEVLGGQPGEISDFLDPHQCRLAEDILRGLPELMFTCDGGYQGAERRRVLLCPEYLDIRLVNPRISYLRIEGDFRQQSVSHRDYLGALLGLGLRREKIGDLLPYAGGSQVIVDRDLVPYIRAQLHQVHKVRVTVTEIHAVDLVVAEEEFDEREGSVASLRLDAVSSHGFRISRTKMVQEIRSEKVKVNWRVVVDPDCPVKVGDVISCRGKGRLVLEEVSGPSKKGRWYIILKKYR